MIVASLLAALVLAGCGGAPNPEPGPPRTERRRADTSQRAGRAKRAAGIEDCPTSDPAVAAVDSGLPDVVLGCLGGGREVRLAGLRGPADDDQRLGPVVRALPGGGAVHRRGGGGNDTDLMILGVDYEDPRPELAIEFAQVLGLDGSRSWSTRTRCWPGRCRSPARRRPSSSGPTGRSPTATSARSVRRADPRPGRAVSGGHAVSSDAGARPDWLRAADRGAGRPGPVRPGGGHPARGRRPAGRGADPDRRRAVQAQTRGPEILFVERPTTMRTHAGQIAFPGGAADPGDADLADTALREAAEETGVDRTGIEVIGQLPPAHVDVSGFDVTGGGRLVGPAQPGQRGRPAGGGVGAGGPGGRAGRPGQPGPGAPSVRLHRPGVHRSTTI